jgi:hypothetical protein
MHQNFIEYETRQVCSAIPYSSRTFALAAVAFNTSASLPHETVHAQELSHME